MKTWNAADAKRRFAGFLQGAATDPQVVLLRGKAVGVLISYQTFERNRAQLVDKSLSQWLDELAPLHELEGDMEVPTRSNRPDTLGDALA